MSIQKANKDVVRVEIAELINKIKELSDRIGNQKVIPQSELDVVLHLIEELHRKTVVWSYLNELPGETVAPAPKEPVVIAPMEPVIAPVAEPILSHVPVSELKQFETVEVPATEPEQRPGEIISNSPAPVSLSIPTPVQEPEMKAPRHVQPIETQLKDIRAFIGFNEKLMYIRQVFRGNNVAYDEALNRINGMKSYVETEAYLSALSEEFKWKKDHEPVEIFLQTVKRRFS